MEREANCEKSKLNTKELLDVEQVECLKELRVFRTLSHVGPSLALGWTKYDQTDIMLTVLSEAKVKYSLG
jgi:hypothetical protein